jgi:hypothetical protein
MKNEFCLFLMLMLLLLWGCSSDKRFPPSKYIGLYGTYNGYKNGSLPYDTDYTGIWHNHDGTITGAYKNGIPVGVWKSYRDNFVLAHMMIFGAGGCFQDIYYYPDGMPWQSSAGKYSFSENGFSVSTESRKYWDLNGNLLSPNVTYLERPNKPIETSTTVAVADYRLESFYRKNGSDMELAIFLIPKVKMAAYEKTTFIFRLDSANKLQATKTFVGSLDLQLHQYNMDENVLKLEFVVKNLKEPRNKIKITVPLRPMTIENGIIRGSRT